MSFHVVSWVLRNSEETLGRRLVLLSLAEFAHDDGSNAYPSVETLSERSRLSTRQVKRCLKGMAEDGVIVAEGEAAKGQTNWRLVMEEGVTICPEGGDNLSSKMDRMSPEAGKESGKEQTPPSPSPEDPVLVVFDHWCKVMDHPRAQLDFKRRRVIKNALKTSAVDDCLRAINGCAASDFHMARGEYKGRTRYDSLSLILRDRENTERFMGMTSQTADPRAVEGRTSSALAVRIREAKRNVLAAYDLAGSDEAVRKGDESERWLAQQGIRVVRGDGRPSFEAADTDVDGGVPPDK